MSASASSGYRPPPLASLGPNLLWLRQHGVSVRCLADAFGTTPNALSVTLSRARRGRHYIPQPGRLSVASPDVGVEPPLGVDDLWHRLWSTASRARQTSDFNAALAEFGQLRTRISQPRSAALLELLAECQTQRAWCATHLSRTTSALRWAQDARQVWIALGRDPALEECTLVEAHAWLYVHRADRSLALLEQHEAAMLRAKRRLGFEFHRQHGTAQMLGMLEVDAGPPTEPLPPFVTAVTALENRDPSPSRAELMFAARQQHVWSQAPDLDLCRETVKEVANWKGAMSLEAVTARVYAAEAALALDQDSTAHRAALEDVTAMVQDDCPFPLQSAVAWLLSRLPRLRLSEEQRRLWIPQIRYFNPHRRW